MVHLERESSNSLFETLEGWEAHFQAENINFSDLSQRVDEEAESDTSDNSPVTPKRKLSAQRLKP